MTDLWKRKLAAYLHDPPSKCLDIATHGDRSVAAFRQAGFVDTEFGEYFAHADHTGAAADRLPFPKSQPAGLQCAFDGIRNVFRHPLSGDELPFHTEFKSVEEGSEAEGGVHPVLTEESLAKLDSDEERWRARFFAHWRLWPKHAMDKDYRLALLPADTRIPDHSIWTHMQVVSALAGCVGSDKVWQPAFLKFQLGPVQDFIAAARCIRDLWSGSHLLSWLMATGMKALSAKVGPDAVIFPSLRGQPLIDLHWREGLWSKVNIGTQTVWESLNWEDSDHLTPNLPNVFLAVVTANEAAAQRAARFDAQVKRFLSVSWQVTPWPASLEAALRPVEGFVDGVPIVEARDRVRAVVDMAEKQMPNDHRDGRFYEGGNTGPKEKLNNIGLGWSVILAQSSWELDAVRQTRTFAAANTGGWQVGAFSNKDALTGRAEAVAGGDNWFKACEKLGEFWPRRFKKPHWLGAATLIKRLWDIAYLKPKWGLDVQRSPNTRGIAAHDPFANDDQFNDEENAEDVENQPASEKYFAVLAFDGDEIGKWVSGEKIPSFATQLANYRDGSGNPGFGSKPYFEKSEFTGFLQKQRPLSPSYHLQFSEALSNFALLCARPLVEAFDGRLVYAGGDDLVALLPADTALECSRALRMAFQGNPELKERVRTAATVLRKRHETERQRNPKASEPPYCQKLAAAGCLLDAEQPGFVRRLDHVDQQHRPIPFLVPGPAADCSVGIAIAHFKAPLQDVVRAAQQAEKRAKRKPESGGLDRRAVDVTLMKRNGDRFPPDFMFELTSEETANLRCQFGISSSSHGGRRYLP